MAKLSKTFRITEEEEKQLQRLADRHYEGNFSMALRSVLKKGLEVSIKVSVQKY